MFFFFLLTLCLTVWMAFIVPIIARLSHAKEMRWVSRVGRDYGDVKRKRGGKTASG